MQPTPKQKETRVFIFEGPDAVGKTTLAKHFAASIGAVYWHMTCTSKLAPAMLDYQLNAVANANANIDRCSVVFDRLWPSELCYGKVFRPDTMINPSVIRAEISKLDPVYVFCFDEKGAEAAADRHEVMLDSAHPYKREDYLQVYREYAELYTLMVEANANIGLHVESRYFDDRIVDQAAIDNYNEGFCQALAAKYLLPDQTPTVSLDELRQS